MSILKSRNRLVTFRLSSEEYGQLEKICVTSGARSISDFARSAVLYRIATHGTKKALLADDLATLSNRLIELDNALKDLSQRIERVLGPTTEQLAAAAR